MASKLHLTLAKLIIISFMLIIGLSGVVIADDNNSLSQDTNTASQFCGGLAGIQCPTGYTCQLDGNYPDSGGTCIVPTTNCIPEGQTMAVYPSNACCLGLTAIPVTTFHIEPGIIIPGKITTTGTFPNIVTTITPAVITDTNLSFCESIDGKNICSNCGNNKCEVWENKCNCPKDCPSVDNNQTTCPTLWEPVCGTDGKTYANECTAKAFNISEFSKGECFTNEITESVRCVFAGSNTTQKCYSEIATCSGKNDCKASVTTTKGKVLTWASSCNGTNTTTVDEASEEIKFDCSNLGCACTLDWNPVCGTNGKTYGNACSAACENVSVAYSGECDKIIVPQEKKYRYAKWTCSDGTVHNEGGPTSCKTETTWKEYAARSCGEVCRSPDAVKEQVKCVFSNAAGDQKCYSDDSKFGCLTQNQAAAPVPETSCVADVYGGKGDNITWKSTCGGYAYTTIDETNEYAKFDCSNSSSLASSGSVSTTTTPSSASSTSGGGSSSTGQFILEVLGIQPATTSATSTTSQANSPTQTSTETIPTTPVLIPYDSENCTQGYVTDFSVSEECQNSGLACGVQAYDEIKAIKEKCQLYNGKVLVTNDATGCPQYSCETTNTTCLKKEDIPEEKFAFCNDNNGQLYVKTDEKGCITFMDCVGATSQSIGIKVPDKIQLLELALKLENLKIEFDKLISKVQALADYYGGKGDSNSADKFTRAVAVLQSAKLKIDGIKDFIRANVDSFDEAKAQQVKDDVSALKEGLLGEVLMILLE